MLTKLQILFGVLAGLAMVVFAAAMISNVNAKEVPGWLGIVVWGCFGVMFGSCLGVIVTLALESRTKKEREEKEEESETSGESEASHLDEPVPEGAEPEHAAVATADTEAFESIEPLDEHLGDPLTE